MFGAITLIAILVAILSRTGNVDSTVQEASADMLRRKIAMAESDLDQVRRLKDHIAKAPNVQVAALVSEKKELADTLEKAKMERESAGRELSEQVAGQNIDFTVEWKKLLAQLAALERKQTEVLNTISAQTENTERLRSRLKEISKLIQHEQDTRVVTLRFPKERAQTKRPFPIICRFGKIYPIYEISLEKNKRSIVWKDKGIDNELSKPIESLGWTAERDGPAISSLLHGISNSEFYITYLVYPDSFDAFRGIRDQAIAAKFDIGLELMRADVDIFWGPGGSMPPPL
jgi:hypothetical protein